MKRFLVKIGLFGGLHAALVGTVLWVYARQFPPGESFYAAGLDKHRLLETRSSPRMIFVGGSSMALGLDSGLVAGQFGFQPINMGLNLEVGLQFMLDEVARSVRRGDIVILSPEYHAFQKHYQAAPEYVARLVECRPALLGSLPFSTTQRLLDRGYLQHLGSVLRVVLKLNTEDVLWDGYVTAYNHRRAFNENGDVVTHHGVDTSKLRRGSPLRFTFAAPELAEAAIEHLNQFQVTCVRRGARVFFSHPPYELKYFELYRPALDRLEAMLQTKLAVPMLDSPQGMVFPSEEIFDVEYHLNWKGKVHRSERMVEGLRKVLPKTE
jgi:hypothetical protein